MTTISGKPADGMNLGTGQSPALLTITASDTTIYSPPLRMIRVGTAAGDVAVVDSSSNSVTVPSVQVGERLQGPFRQVLSTGTVATGLTGWI